ncbi:hypothetical protein BRARA_K01775 [Brassica rapa]|uniref:RING-type domain-containing protein n=1 Tax=Brassica campestris TaxID=3711 RepID=A0A397KWV5_BRACM|nr:hypothetical protein BRARA_K01775 [Brassica rapa]
MENQKVSCHDDELSLNHIVDEEDFRSCCGDEQLWLKETDDNTAKVEKRDELDDEFSVRLFFKGVSITERGDSSSGQEKIFELIQVQKKLDFYAQDSVANYLALLDGLTVALENNLRSVVAVTDSELLYNQITNKEKLETPIFVALRERVLEKTSSLDGFVLKLAPLCDLDQALTLARVAVGICNLDVVDDKQGENCSICCEDRRAEIMLTLKCTHKFCSHCMKTYVQGRVESSEVPIRCPQVQCNNHLSASECKSFLPVSSFRSFEEANMRCEECGHEFCYCCGGEYREGQQSCTCDFWDDEKEEEYQENTIQELEQWPWDAFSSMPSVMDAYSEQERSQLALIQRFLAGGGFSISDHHTFYQSPPPQPPCRESSYVEAAMKDIHQLPWLERFVSVISDDYYEEYINSQ